MDKEKLIERCSILEKVIIDVSKLYNSKETSEYQKALLETMIGAAIWYLPSSDELYSGYISKKAVEEIRKGTPLNKLTQEHRFPRKQAGKILLKEKYKYFIEKKVSLYDLYLSEFGQFNYVVKSENRALVKFQKTDEHSDAYTNAGIETIEMSIDELKSLMTPKRKYSRKSKLEIEHQDELLNNVLYSDNADTGRKVIKTHQLISPRDFGNRNESPTSNLKNLQSPGPKEQTFSEKIGDNNVDLVGIYIGDKYLEINNPNTTKCYITFMNYCIDHFPNVLLSLEYSGRYFSDNANDTKFGSAIKYNRIVAHNGLYYHTHLDSARKIKIIENIAKENDIMVGFKYKQ